MDFSFFISNILPIITTLAICVGGYYIKRIEKLEDEVKLIHKDIGEIKGQIGELKGLITGYFSRPAPRE